MRQAEITDYKKTVLKRKYPHSIANIEIETDSHNSKIIFNGGINAICGRNGSGKSIILSAITLAISDEEKNIELNEEQKFFDFKLTAQLIGNNEIYQCRITSDSGKISIDKDHEDLPEILTLDTVRTIPKVLTYFRELKNLEEFLEQYEVKNYSDKDISDINYITGNLYTDIQQFEIETGDNEIAPFFVVQRNNSRYTAIQMGQGEYSLFYIYWLIKTAKNCVLIIEEPESFTTPDSQRKLGSYFIKHSAQFGVWILLSTHSEQILSTLNPSSIHSVKIRDGRIQASTSNQKTMKHLERLGLSTAKRGLFLVEDHAAKLFLQRCLVKHTSIKNSFYICDYEGEGNICNALKHLHKARGTFKFIGVFDGDLREKCTLDRNEHDFVFLPSSLSPEELLFNSLVSDSLPDNFLGLAEEEILEAIEICGALNLHDRFPKLSHSASLSYEDVFSRTFDFWASSTNGAKMLDSFLSELENIVE